jgi:hypothetical protein
LFVLSFLFFDVNKFVHWYFTKLKHYFFSNTHN